MLRALRAEQWVKNLLVFVPLILAHRVSDRPALGLAAWAFLCFCLCASAVYVVNDIADIENDRRHPRKRHRPFAAGALQVREGRLLAALLLVSALVISVWQLPAAFTALLAGYFALTTAYSFLLKRVIILDVLVLATLYTFRLIGGGLATNVPLSPWLLAFSTFVFLSLALVKRYAGLHLAAEQGIVEPAGRGYRVDDLQFILTIGPASGYIGVLVLVLYINSAAVSVLYGRPGILWLLTPLLLYWISRIWLLAFRGELPDDPIVFTIRDPASYLVLACSAVLLAVASAG